MIILRGIVKSIVIVSIAFICTGLFLSYERDIIQIYNEKILHKYNNIKLEKNEYFRRYDYMFVQNSRNFLVESKQDIYNIFYTAINSGDEAFEFYCKYDYKECEADLTEVASDRDLLSGINNYTHPFNSFAQIETKLEAFGKVTIFFKKNYRDDEIKLINDEVDRVYNAVVKPNDSIRNKILSLHNYIVVNTKYDSGKISDMSVYSSDKALGPLFDGYGICSGYTDAMQLFLEKLGVNNYRVSSDNHIWNAVEVDGKWYHLDLTWDDPVTVGVPELDLLEHSFFLISTKELLNFNTGEHIFDQDIYKELKVED